MNNQITLPPLIAILRGIQPHEVLEHAKVLYNAGFRMIEVPANSPAWNDSVQILQDHFQDTILIGAGTILKEEEVNLLQKTGAKMMVTPNVNPSIIQMGTNCGLESFIGAITPTEILLAQQSGAKNIKIFPAGTMGIEYCKAVLSISYKNTPFYAVGGITVANLSEYLSHGFVGAGIGSELYKSGQSPEITAKKALLFIQAYYNFKTENNKV